MSRQNGAKLPTVRYVLPCPCCEHLHALPDWAPALYAWTCGHCGVRVESHLGRDWKGEA